MSEETLARQGRTGRLAAAWHDGPLAVRDFRLLSAGQFTSTVGDYCYAVALPWMILSAHGGTVLLGTVLACYGITRTVLIPLGGVLADKLRPRTVMLVADVVRCALVAALAVIAARAQVSLAFLGPVAAVLGAGEGLFLPASTSIMPSLLSEASLQAGNAISTAMMQAGSLAGPVLGGILVTTAGPASAFAVDAATFAVSAAALALMSGHRVAATAAGADAAGHAPAAAPAAAMDSGGSGSRPPAKSAWRLLVTSRLLQIILIVAVLANFVLAGTFDIALPALAHARFGAVGFGTLIACSGGGSLAGTLAAAKFGSLRRPAQAAASGIIVGAVAVCLVPFAGGLPGAVAADLLFGAATSFGNVILITLLQRWAPPHLLGRVMSLVMLASIGAFPVAVALSGAIVRGIGPAPFFPAAGAALALAVLFALSQREFRDFGAAEPPLDQAAVVMAR